MSRIRTTTITLMTLLAVAPGAHAGSPQRQARHPNVRYPEHAAKAPPLRHVPELPGVVYDVRKLERKMLPNRLGSPDSPQAPVVQDTWGGPSAATTGVSFEGLNNRNNVLPPDTVGDIGPNHYVQMTNLSFAVFDRAGAVLYGPVNSNTLWSALGPTNVCVQNNDGDPVVLYDQAADRWLASQFALPNYPNGPFYQCIAVSKTGDPTGEWHLYAYRISNTKMNDYPKFGVWGDGYYLSVNQFLCNLTTCNWAGAGVGAFERDKMLNGDPAARLVYFDLNAVDPNLGGMLPADWDGPTPPPAGAPNPFVQVDDNSWGYAPDGLQVWNFHVDWANTANSAFTFAQALPAAPFDSNLCGYRRNCIPQPGGTAVDAIADRLMYRLQYRNFGGHQSLVTNHTVDTGADHAGIRWYELRDEGAGWFVRQQGTYAPDADHRWMGSVAMNGAGDIGLGYSVSGAGTYPSIRFTGRLAADIADVMTQGEGAVVNGGGSQGHSSGRWGDYSLMAVDPLDDCTFWYTQEYYAADSSAGWRTRVGSFRLADCAAADTPPAVTLTSPAEGATVSGTVALAAAASDDHGVAQVEFRVDDALLCTDASGGDGWSCPWDTAGQADGAHTVTAVATDGSGQTGSDSNAVVVANAPAPTVHVADLDGSSAAASKGRWNATVTITVRDGSGASVGAATVSGAWSGGATGGASCTTNGAGQCQVTKTNLKARTAAVTFTVTAVSGNYAPADNSDPDGDSNGTTITVRRP